MSDAEELAVAKVVGVRDLRLGAKLGHEDLDGAHREGARAERGPNGLCDGGRRADGLDAAARQKLSKVLDEVLSTERTYVAALAALTTSFLPILKPHFDATPEAAELLPEPGVGPEGRSRLKRLGSRGWSPVGVAAEPGSDAGAVILTSLLLLREEKK